jgi:hypothetical protein
MDVIEQGRWRRDGGVNAIRVWNDTQSWGKRL